MEFRICASGKYLLSFNSKLCIAILRQINQSITQLNIKKKQIKVHSFNPDMYPKSHTEHQFIFSPRHHLTVSAISVVLWFSFSRFTLNLSLSIDFK